MNLAEVYHHEAVHLSEQADIARVKHPSIDYKALYFKAFELEKAAALQMNSETFQPLPRTWMMQSAAALAYKAGKYAEAEETIALCRSLDPDEYTLAKLDELEELVRKAAAQPHENGSLHLTGILTSADGDEKEIRIRDPKTQQVYALMVPAGMFKKVVKTYWLETVSAVAKVSPHGVFTLEKINLAPAA